MIGTKQVKLEDGKMAKPGMVVENIMVAWNDIINSSKKELYAESVIRFKSVCVRYSYLLKCVKCIILDQDKEKIVCAWTDQVRHFGNTTTNKVEFAHVRLKN